MAESSAPQPPHLSPDDSLPPVEPPSAGFLLKLFVVPALIVFVVVLVVLLFNWLAHLGTDPKKYVESLERGAADSWQRAHDLSVELRRSDALKRDAELARRLADMLRRRLQTPPPPEESEAAQNEVRMRVFLTKALGEFAIETPLPVLLQAATTQRNANELDVRLAALESIVVLLSNLEEARGEPLSGELREETLEVALELSRESGEDGQLLRSRATFALGLLGGPEAVERLAEMLEDGYVDARYNAAITLARRGDVGAAPVLAEMLEADQPAGRRAEKEEGGRAYKEALIHVNGLRAALALAEKNPEADLSELLDAAQRLRRESDLPKPVELKARELELALRQRGD